VKQLKQSVNYEELFIFFSLNHRIKLFWTE